MKIKTPLLTGTRLQVGIAHKIIEEVVAEETKAAMQEMLVSEGIQVSYIKAYMTKHGIETPADFLAAMTSATIDETSAAKWIDNRYAVVTANRRKFFKAVIVAGMHAAPRRPGRPE